MPVFFVMDTGGVRHTSGTSKKIHVNVDYIVRIEEVIDPGTGDRGNLVHMADGTVYNLTHKHFASLKKLLNF